MKIPSCSEEIFREENLILYQLRYCYFTLIPVTIGCKKKQWPVSTRNNFTVVFFIKSLVRKRPYLVFHADNSDFFQASVAKE